MESGKRKERVPEKGRGIQVEPQKGKRTTQKTTKSRLRSSVGRSLRGSKFSFTRHQKSGKILKGRRVSRDKGVTDQIWQNLRRSERARATKNRR